MTDDGGTNQSEPGRAVEPEPPPLLGPALPGVPVVEIAQIPPPRTGPPVLSAVLAPIVAIPATLIVGSIAVLVPMFIMYWPEISASGGGEDAFRDALEKFLTSPAGLLLGLIPAELTYLGFVLLATRFSRQRWRDRLAMHRPKLPWWAYLLFAVAAPACGMLGGYLATLLGRDDSDAVDYLFEGFQSMGPAVALAAILLYSILPGLCEEMFFRGYVQSRLLRRWPPAVAVLFAGVCFSIAHFEPAHALLVFPLGIWLGILAWRCGSIWPSIITHALNNAYGVSFMALVPAEDVMTMQEQWTIGTAAVACVSVVALIASCIYLFTRPIASLGAAGPDL